MSNNCVSCNDAPSPCNCSSTQTCVQTPRNCTTCPQNICINSNDSIHHPSSAGLGGIVGGVIGATTAIVLILLSLWILYKRNYFKINQNIPYSKNLTLNKFNQTTTTTSKHKSIFSRQLNNNDPTHPSHQSVIFLPTDDIKDPKSGSLESDDDPFSDVHSGVSIISPRPTSNPTTLPYPIDDPGESSPSLFDQNSPSVPNTASTTLVKLNQRTSFLSSTFGLPVPPPPTGNPSNAFRPTRPHRAPDLDLRLPGAKARIDADQPPSPHKQSNHHLRPNDPSTVPTTPTTSSYTQQQQQQQQKTSSPNKQLDQVNNLDSNQSSESHSSSTSPIRERLSRFSDTASHDSHLSSILDPAMIVTPVTLVRTASGRQAAVQRVALRGQEKARVVRLPPSLNPKPHVPSPLSLETNDAKSLSVDSEKFPETFKFTPCNDLALGSRLSWDPDSPLPPNGDSSVANQPVQSNHTNRQSNSHGSSKNWITEETTTSTGINLNRNRSTAAYSTRSSIASSSVCESFIMDEEEVEFPTVLGRSAASQRPSALNSQTNSVDNPSSVSHHQIHMKALGRDRAISLSSIIGEEAARDSFLSSPFPPLPPIPNQIKLSNTLPEPFKPFAGQKPSGSSSSNNNRNKADQPTVRQAEMEKEGGERSNKRALIKSIGSNSNSSQLSRLSNVSSIRSGYGSVLEGIPFNIELNSESVDLFNLHQNNSSSDNQDQDRNEDHLNFSFNDTHYLDDSHSAIVAAGNRFSNTSLNEDDNSFSC